eukprot:6081347-Pyramimonas_sp.AAC.1
MLYSKQVPKPPEGWVERATHMAPLHPYGIAGGRRRNRGLRKFSHTPGNDVAPECFPTERVAKRVRSGSESGHTAAAAR